MQRESASRAGGWGDRGRAAMCGTVLRQSSWGAMALPLGGAPWKTESEEVSRHERHGVARNGLRETARIDLARIDTARMGLAPRSEGRGVPGAAQGHGSPIDGGGGFAPTPRSRSGCLMRARLLRFGEVEIDGRTFDHDVVVEASRISRRHKKASKAFRDRYGHTPLSLAEQIPWAATLIVGTGADGALPVMDEVREEAERRGVRLAVMPTREACRLLSASDPRTTAAILHVTC